ncbi:MAG: RNA polymerase sigma factor [Bacteroidota bacterium]
MDKQSEDKRLIRQALQGKQAAYRNLYNLYKHSLFLVCLRYAKDRATAQDYLQEAFINIFKKLHHFDSEKGAFEPWAKRVTINICLMHIRKHSLYAVNLSAAEEIHAHTADALSNLSLQEMLEMIRQLPQGYKTIFNMYVIDGFSHKEIAATLEISVNTSKTQLRKARHLLQKKFIANQHVYRSIHG